MASPAQCIANVQNATLSTGPKTAEGKAAVARNSVRHGLFTAYAQLAPEHCDLINRYIEDMHAGFPPQCPAFEEAIRRFAIATWRWEVYLQLESSFYSSGVAAEMQIPESAALAEQFGENILLGLAVTRDCGGPNVFGKLSRYESRLNKELDRAREAYLRVSEAIQSQNHRAEPIPQPQAAAPLPEAPESPAQTPRNAPCPCGSGQKYKRCCGVAAHAPQTGGLPTVSQAKRVDTAGCPRFAQRDKHAFAAGAFADSSEGI